MGRFSRVPWFFAEDGRHRVGYKPETIYLARDGFLTDRGSSKGCISNLGGVSIW
jgi:hypothetical protein